MHTLIKDPVRADGRAASGGAAARMPIMAVAVSARPQGGSGAWIEKPTRIKFSLGGVLLGRATFPALVLDAHFEKLGDDPAVPWPPLKRAAKHVRAALVNSHPVAHGQRRVVLVDGMIRYVPHQYRRFYVTLNGCFEGYLKKFSSQRRNHLSRMMKKFARASGGRIDWREYKRSDEMDEFHRLGRELSSKTYQEKLIDSGLPDGEAFREQMKELAGRDGVRGYILFFEGKPIAYQYCPAIGDVLAHWKCGYDPEYRQHSPGNVLLYLAIERLFAEKQYRIFDFGSGEFEYKQVFGTDSKLCADIYYFRRTWRNAALVLAHSALGVAFSAARRGLDAVGMRQKLKRLIRGHA